MAGLWRMQRQKRDHKAKGLREKNLIVFNTVSGKLRKENFKRRQILQRTNRRNEIRKLFPDSSGLDLQRVTKLSC